MRIMEICLSTALGGLELYMIRTVKELKKTNAIVPVVSNKPSIIKERLDEMNLRYFELNPMLHELPLLSAFKLAKIIDQEKINAIHVHTGNDLPLAAFAKWLSRTYPNLLYTRQMKISHNKNDPYHNFIYSQVNKFIVITEQLKEDLQARINNSFKDNLHLLYYGTESPTLLNYAQLASLKNSLSISEDQFVIGLFGQINQGKGQHLLVEALERMVLDKLNFRALIVGFAQDDQYLFSLKESAVKAGAIDRIVFMDFVRNPQDFMQICDCVVLTTYQETFGLVLIEAMSLKKAVIGSNKGGVLEIIEDGKTGLLFESKNSFDLYQKLSKLYHNRDLLRELAEAGYKKACEVFNHQKHYEKLQELMR